MKKFLTLLLAAGMIVSAANGASAVEMKVSGSWLTSFTFADGLFGVDPLKEDADDGSFRANQQINLQMDLVMSESLSGTLLLRVADGQGGAANYQWGTLGTGGQGKAVTARRAYLDWMIPTTDVLVRMGRQGVALPSYTFGSPVFDNTIDGVMVSAPINDTVAVNAGWLRPSATSNAWGKDHVGDSNIDLAYLGVDVAGDGFNMTPWGVVGVSGKNNILKPDADMWGFGAPEDSRTTVYWVGLGGELTMFDPFKFTADFIYSGNDADGEADRKGWYAALGAEMKAGFATPFVRGWYASGDDADSKGSKRMLSIKEGGTFDASAIYFDAYALLGATIDECSPAGTWGVQAGLKGVSFVEDLTHRLSLTYFQGTNNVERVRGKNTSPVGYMTTSDSAWEIDFLSSYKLYQNLTANLLLAYLITDFDENIRATKYDNGFRGTLNFTYAF